MSMKVYKKQTWQHEITTFEEKAELFGVNIFECDWHRTGKSASVQDPLYHQQYSFDIYSIVVDGETKQFAAGEFSNGVWGFYLLKY